MCCKTKTKKGLLGMIRNKRSRQQLLGRTLLSAEFFPFVFPHPFIIRHTHRLFLPRLSVGIGGENEKNEVRTELPKIRGGEGNKQRVKKKRCADYCDLHIYKCWITSSTASLRKKKEVVECLTVSFVLDYCRVITPAFRTASRGCRYTW